MEEKAGGSDYKSGLIPLKTPLKDDAIVSAMCVRACMCARTTNRKESHSNPPPARVRER